MSNIIEQFSDVIKGQLSTFDRMIFKGYIRQLCNVQQMIYFLSYNNVLYKNFSEYVGGITRDLCKHIEDIAKEQNRPYVYLNSPKISKEETALKMLHDSPIDTGLIGIISSVELCSTMTVGKNTQTDKLEVKWADRKCKYYYLYYLDEEFGWMHVKIQTWFPFTAQIYINGREHLSKILSKEGIGYKRYDNCFTHIDDLEKAQIIANKMVDVKISDSFDGIIKKINSFLPVIEKTFNHGYYWCLTECEYATDIMFKSRQDLEAIFSSLVEKSFFTFKCDDVMSFFGRKLDPKFQGEIVSDMRKRHQGFRIKHKMKSNQVKMYDKCSVLRIETTINEPHEFKVLKNIEKVSNGKKTVEKRWVPMGKGVSNLYRYAEVSKAINNRYINALPNPIDKETPIKAIEELASCKTVNGRRIGGFNLLECQTALLFESIAKGKFIINGITNSTLRSMIFAKEDYDSIKFRGKTTRLLSKLRLHGILKKPPHSSKYYLTSKGRKVITSILLFKEIELPETFSIS